ncbi:MAG: aminodeoxychorismate/anthranilate synthase component II [Planctomycetota bacterium]
MILLIDNYDSFTFNLQRYLRQLGVRVHVVRNDATELDESLTRLYSAIVISPGPKSPAEAGKCLSVIKQWSGKLPILGVCLGHQSIYESFGGKVIRSNQPIHGRSTPVHVVDSTLFEGIQDGTRFARYHSLVCDPATLPDSLRVAATSEDSQIMAIEHRQHATFGVQFHPESVLSLDGHRLLRNFLHLSRISTPTWNPDEEKDCPSLLDVQPIQVAALEGMARTINAESESIAVLPRSTSESSSG